MKMGATPWAPSADTVVGVRGFSKEPPTEKRYHVSTNYLMFHKDRGILNISDVFSVTSWDTRLEQAKTAVKRWLTACVFNNIVA